MIQHKCSIQNWDYDSSAHRIFESPQQQKSLISENGEAVMIAIDETVVKSNGDWYWSYVAINIGSQLILDVAVFGRRGTDLAATFLHRLIETQDLTDTVLLVDGHVYLTSVSRLGVSGQLGLSTETYLESVSHSRDACRSLPQFASG